jgi:short-subunit dehydrogenase
MNLVLTARRKDRLVGQAFQPAAGLPPGVRTECVPLDLEDPKAPWRLFEFTESRGIEPDLLVNNAGFGMYGELKDLDPDRQLAMIQVNCAAVATLTSLYLPGMVRRRKGEILIVASTAAFQAVPYQSAYAATKAFDLIFAEGIAEEVKRYGVRVCALCPGQTETEFHAVANEPIPKGMSVHTSEEVARIGLKALRAGRHYVICGLSNKLGMELQRIAPRRVVTKVSERLFRPGRKV